MEKNVPTLRFPEFKGEWAYKKIGNDCSFEQGIQVDLQFHINEPKEGYVKFLRIENYTQCSNDFRYVPVEMVSKKRISKDDIVVVRYGATAGFIAKGYDGVLANNLFKVNPIKEILNNDYLYVFLKSYKVFKFFQTEMVGGAMPALSFEIVKSLKISYPTLPEQTKIANFLTAVDEKISALKKKKELLEQYKKGVMQQIFSKQLRFKDDNGDDFAEWEKVTLGDITYKVGKKNNNNIQYPIYSINNKTGFVPQSEQFEGMDSNQRGYDISMYKIIEKNTFAYNPARINVGSLGYSGKLNDIIISSLYVCFKTNENVNDNFLLQYFNTPEFNFMVNNYTEGGVRQYLFYENFSIISLNLPSIPEQTKIANFLSVLDEKMSHCGKEIEGMETWKKGLLQQMFV